MLDIKRNYIITANKGEPELIATGMRQLGASSSRNRMSSSRPHQVKSWTNANTAGYGGMGVGQTSTTINTPQLMLDGILIADPRIKRRIFRDIYYHDAIAGGAVDVYSTLPFSDFHLEGTKDREVIETFHRSLEQLHLRTFFPAASRDYLVLGAFIGTASFDEKQKIFTSIMPQNIDQCLSATTKVLTCDGWKTIGEIAEPKSSRLAISYQVNGKTYPGTAPFFVGKKATYELMLDNGKSIRATDNHKFLVYRQRHNHDRSYATSWVELKDLVIGDKIAINSYKPQKVEKNKEYYEAYLMGVLMGDGTILATGMPQLAYKDTEKRVEITSNIIKTKAISNVCRDGRGYARISFNHRARELMDRYRPVNNQSINISNLTQLMGYLSGLICANGWVQDRIHVSGGEYLKDVHDWLIQYGCGNTKLEKAANKGDDSVFIHGLEIVSQRSEDIYVLTIGKSDCRNIIDNLELTSSKLEKLQRSLAKPSLNKLPFSKVVSKCYAGVENVYDIYVPGIHRFVANGMIVHNCILTQVPLWGFDPLIDLTLPKMLLTLFANDQGDPRVKNIINRLPPNIQTRLADGKIPLDPATTIFLPKRTLSADTLGTSFYERLLPVHLMEKALFRGTIDLAYRRQAPLLHITVGGDDDWIPNEQDMDVVRDMFLQGDMDPAGAIIVTRTGISPAEVRSPMDFWRVDTMFDFSAAMKYRALGISESIITGEATLSSLDASLSVMVDNLRYYRATVAREMFYLKLFPALSAANNFRYNPSDHRVIAKDSTGKNVNQYYRRYGGLSSIREHNDDYIAVCADTRFPFANMDLQDDSLIIPKIVWHKHLNPEGDSVYIEQLQALQAQGIPIPLGMFAAAGGISLPDILDAMPQELNIRKKIAKFQEQMEEIMPQQQQGEEDQYQTQAAIDSIIKTSSRYGVNGRPKDRAPAPSVFGRDHRGQLKEISPKGQKVIEERLLRKLGGAYARHNAARNAQIKAARPKRKAFVSNIYGKL